MRLFKLLPLLLVIFSSLDCTGIPFKSIDYVPLDNFNPVQVRGEFNGLLVDKLQVINSIVFQYKWQSFSALGYTQVDLENSTFEVSCMNPVGIKLFELTGNRNEVKPTFVLKELLQRGDLPRAVGEDIRRIYFDMLPGPQAKIEKQKYKIIFTQPIDKGIMKYIFAGKDHLLVEKHYYEKGNNLWTVYYYAYQMNKERLYPSEIILRHHRYGYNLIIRLKEVR